MLGDGGGMSGSCIGDGERGLAEKAQVEVASVDDAVLVYVESERRVLVVGSETHVSRVAYAEDVAAWMCGGEAWRKGIEFAVSDEEEARGVGRVAAFAVAIEDGGGVLEMRASPLPTVDCCGHPTSVAVVVVIARAAKVLFGGAAIGVDEVEGAGDAATRRDHVPEVRVGTQIRRRGCLIWRGG